MPVDRDAVIEISAFSWVPTFARGLVRDLRVRWALEEARLDYRERVIDPRAARPQDYLLEQPFGQVPSYRDAQVRMFESGAIVLHLALQHEALMPADAHGRGRTLTWAVAALNSVEPMVVELSNIDLFNADAEWAKARRPEAEQKLRERLGRLSGCLGQGDYLEGAFTAGDLLMTTVLRILRHTALVSEHPNLALYMQRCEARPAFERALAAQLAVFDRESSRTA